MSQLDAAISEARAAGLRFVAVRVAGGWRVWDVHREALADDGVATEARATADAEWLNSPEPLAEEPDITPIGED